MNAKNISAGILLLILALVVVPESSAYATFKEGGHTHPITATQAAACKACHVESGAPLDLQTCSRCHEDPFPPTVTSSEATPQTETAASEVTTTNSPTTPEVTTTNSPTTPGFEIVAAMVGLFACSLRARRKNK